MQRNRRQRGWLWPVLFALLGTLGCSSLGSPAERLEGEWTFVEIGGAALGELSGVEAAQVSFHAGEAGADTAAGTTGVNRFSGSYEAEGDQLRFGPLAVTRRAGPPAAMEREGLVLGVLDATRTWRVRDGWLELHGEGGLLARLRAR